MLIQFIPRVWGICGMACRVHTLVWVLYISCEKICIYIYKCLCLYHYSFLNGTPKSRRNITIPFYMYEHYKMGLTFLHTSSLHIPLMSSIPKPTLPNLNDQFCKLRSESYPCKLDLLGIYKHKNRSHFV